MSFLRKRGASAAFCSSLEKSYETSIHAKTKSRAVCSKRLQLCVNQSQRNGCGCVGEALGTLVQHGGTRRLRALRHSRGSNAGARRKERNSGTAIVSASPSLTIRLAQMAVGYIFRKRFCYFVVFTQK